MSTPDADFALDLRDLVPQPDTCEMLDERGFDMVTHFFWDHDRLLRAERGYQPSPSAARLPAPTAAELGRVLPREVRYEGVPYSVRVELGFVYYTVFYITGDERMMFGYESAKTEAEARARSWLRLESAGLLDQDFSSDTKRQP
jgi:hypothetical protein